MVCHQKINSSVEIINQAALTLFCHAPGSLSGYVIFLDSLRCRDLTAAQLDTKDREYLDKSWCAESSSNLPSRVLVGWSQPKEDLDRQNFGVRASSSKLVWRFSGSFSAKILARKFSSAFDFFQTNWEKEKRKNKKIRATFGVYNSQVSCPEEAPGGASSARRGSWQSFCARKPPPGAPFASRTFLG